MSTRRRIRTVYGKELLDILRDRRTLIAMIVVPIVLYPLLMIGSIQAVSMQTDALEEESVVIGVTSETQKNSLQELVEFDTRYLRERRARAQGDPEALERIPRSLHERISVIVYQSVDELKQAIQSRRIHVGIELSPEDIQNDPAVQNKITPYVDMEEVRSRSAWRTIEDMLARIEKETNARRKAAMNLPPTFDQPFAIEVVDLSSPPSILGQILPLVLVLMTITGAIYPAIDLTAGERERGTLESLMVSPVPVFDVIVGKFLVVTTVAIMGAALNLASVSATVYFGGFDQVIAAEGGGLPVASMFLILICLIPFAVLMSAIMLAVCSYARTFKEAQNYVTPVILAVLIPGGIAALPTSRLEGAMLVMPVGNMVLLARELLLGAFVPIWQIGGVLLSTTLYAVAAVALAANIFGRESVVFADSGSIKASLTRSYFKPVERPSVSMALLVVALLFPLWFFIQSALSADPGATSMEPVLRGTALMMPIIFVGVPTLVLLYWKVDVLKSYAFRWPAARYWIAGLLIGVTAWVPVHEISIILVETFGIPESLRSSSELLAKSLRELPILEAILLIAFIPAVCEELLFRGFLLSGLRGSMGRWKAVLISAAVFGVFHVYFLRFPITFGLGIILALLAWNARSILPAIVAHALHNAISGIAAAQPELYESLGLASPTEDSHLPGIVIVVAVVLLGIGLGLAGRQTKRKPTTPAQFDLSDQALGG